MKNKLFELFAQFPYPYFMQGTLGKDEKYEDHFFTWFNPYTEDKSAFDNIATITDWEFNVAFYSIDTDLVDSVLLELRRLALAAGYEVNGKGQDVYSDRRTHTGRLITIIIKEQNNE